MGGHYEELAHMPLWPMQGNLKWRDSIPWVTPHCVQRGGRTHRSWYICHLSYGTLVKRILIDIRSSTNILLDAGCPSCISKNHVLVGWCPIDIHQCIYYMSLKFLTSSRVEELRSDPRESHQCYMMLVTIPKKTSSSFSSWTRGCWRLRLLTLTPKNS